MRALMGLIKDRHGTYYAQKKVPERLQEAVARVLNSGRDRQVFLKKSLGTKSLKAANIAATHVLADFDRTFADAEALLKERPVIPSLTDAQVKRMAEILACEQAGVAVTLPKPQTSGAKSAGRFGKPDFVYLAKDDVYRCPAGEKLAHHFTADEDGQKMRIYATAYFLPPRVKVGSRIGAMALVHRKLPNGAK